MDIRRVRRSTAARTVAQPLISAEFLGGGGRALQQGHDPSYDPIDFARA